jgi:hypothetical protein
VSIWILCDWHDLNSIDTKRGLAELLSELLSDGRKCLTGRPGVIVRGVLSIDSKRSAKTGFLAGSVRAC